jgi:small conductance mechanosensitive channel
MLNRVVITIQIITALALTPAAARAAAADSAAPQPSETIEGFITTVRAAARSRDSLAALAREARGASREYLEETIWQRDAEVHQAVLEASDWITGEKGKGHDVTQAQQRAGETLRQEWPGHLAELRRHEQALRDLRVAADSTSGAARLALESDLTEASGRLLDLYQMLVEGVLALEHAGVDASAQRKFLVKELPTIAAGMVTRLQLASRDQAGANARLAGDPSNPDLRNALATTEERLNRVTRLLAVVIHLMDRLGLDTSELRVALISTTGRITLDVFHWKVLLGLTKMLWGQIVDLLAVRIPHLLFQGLLIVVTFLGFRAASNLVRRGVRRAIQRSSMSELMRSTVIGLSARSVMVIGFLVILTQLGLRVAPLLAGLGIAGVAVGFALQNSLANFAAGGMILGTRPFDVGDEIEVAGVLGIVRHMSLVSTTILTADNQTLIVPNNMIWTGVIRNRTTQPQRRVDLIFGIDYSDDVDKAERALREVVLEHTKVLREPAPVIKLHQLADSSVNFVVRAWAARENYQDVYWDLTRAVKLRFDREGITIPFPQRELHISSGEGQEAGNLLGPVPPSKE